MQAIRSTLLSKKSELTFDRRQEQLLLMVKPEDWVESSNWDVCHMTCSCLTRSSSEYVNTTVNILQRRVSRRAAWCETSRGKRVICWSVVLCDQAVDGFRKGVAEIVAITTETARDRVEVLMFPLYEFCLKIAIAGLISLRPPDSSLGGLELLHSVKVRGSVRAAHLQARPRGMECHGCPCDRLLVA